MISTKNTRLMGVVTIVTIYTLVAVSASIAIRAAISFVQIYILSNRAVVVTGHGSILVYIVVPSVFFVILRRALFSTTSGYGSFEERRFTLFLATVVLIVVGSFFVPTGWTVYPPLSTVASTKPVAVASLLMCVIVFSWSVVLACAGRRIVGTSVYTPAHSVMLVGCVAAGLILPLVALVFTLLVCDVVFGTSFFAESSGSAFTFQHMFWVFGHPEVYLLTLPILGAVLSTRILFRVWTPTIGARKAPGGVARVFVLSFLVWGHHLFTTQQSMAASLFFVGTSLYIAIPMFSAILSVAGKPHNFTQRIGLVETAGGTVAGGLRLASWGLGAVFVCFMLGGASIFLVLSGFARGVHGTRFVAGHFHLFFVGVVVTVVSILILQLIRRSYFKRNAGCLKARTLAAIVAASGAFVVLASTGRSYISAVRRVSGLVDYGVVVESVLSGWLIGAAAVLCCGVFSLRAIPAILYGVRPADSASTNSTAGSESFGTGQCTSCGLVTPDQAAAFEAAIRSSAFDDRNRGLLFANLRRIWCVVSFQKILDGVSKGSILATTGSEQVAALFKRCLGLYTRELIRLESTQAQSTHTVTGPRFVPPHSKSTLNSTAESGSFGTGPCTSCELVTADKVATFEAAIQSSAIPDQNRDLLLAYLRGLRGGGVLKGSVEAPARGPEWSSSSSTDSILDAVATFDVARYSAARPEFLEGELFLPSPEAGQPISGLCAGDFSIPEYLCGELFLNSASCSCVASAEIAHGLFGLALWRSSRVCTGGGGFEPADIQRLIKWLTATDRETTDRPASSDPTRPDYEEGELFIGFDSVCPGSGCDDFSGGFLT